MNSSSAPSAPADDWGRRLLSASDAARLLALTALAVLGPALHALAAGRLTGAGQPELGPGRLLLLHAMLAGLLGSGLHLLPLAVWSSGAGSLAETTCRLGRTATDALFATQSLLLTAALLSQLRRPPGPLLAAFLLLLWLIGAGLNFGQVHWRATAGAPYQAPFVESEALFSRDDDVGAVIADAARSSAFSEAVTGASATPAVATDEAATDVAEVTARDSAVAAAVAAAGMASAEDQQRRESGCAEEESAAPLWRQSRARAAAAAAPLLLSLAGLQLLCRRREPLGPLLAVLAAVRTASCGGQLLVLALAAGRQPGGLLDGAAGVLRDAGQLLEVTLLLVLYQPPPLQPPTPPPLPRPPSPVRIMVQDQGTGPSPPRQSQRPARTRAARSAALTWQRPRVESSSWTCSETW